MSSSKMLVALLALQGANAVVMQRTESNANPIRKVVTMLQKMQTQVTAEGEHEEELYEKFMCYCKTGVGTLDASIAAAKNKLEALEAELKGASERKKQAEADLKEEQASRAEAKEAMAAGTAIREKEAAAFKKETSDLNANLAALTKAIAAIESGMSGAFLQTNAANVLKQFAMEKAQLPDMDRQELLAFLSGTQQEGYVPQSGEITGILKTIKDEMEKSLADATAAEEKAAADYEALMAAKTKEVEALTKQIEANLAIIADLGVGLAAKENDLEDTKESLSEDEKFLIDLQKGCATKTQEWEEVKKTRAEESVALAETIKVLNDDDALELFKKTLPGSASALVELKVSSEQIRTKALMTVRALPRRPELDLIALALNGKQKGFEKVIKMIDSMVELLHKEQGDDDSKKSYCAKEFDASEDKQKALENSIADSETAIADLEGSLATLKDEIAALQADIKSLDNAVADATSQRKEEHATYTALISADSTAKEVLGWAKNRLNKFYNPKLYKAPPARDLSDTESVTVSMGGTLAPTPAPGGIAGTGIGASFEQINSRLSGQVAPPPPPETFGPYTKKGEESTGVIAMIDLLIADLDKEMQESEVMEKDAQKEYEEFMSDSSAKRGEDSKSLADKVSAKASAEEALQAETDKKAGTSNELMTTLEYISSLHGECDWLLRNYDLRKSSRTEEIDALGRAKAVLSGADYSLLQTVRSRASNFLGF